MELAKQGVRENRGNIRPASAEQRKQRSILLTVVVSMVLRVVIRSERPYCILKTHRWLHMGRGVESVKIAARMDNRGKLLLPRKEESIAIHIQYY